MKVIIEFNIDSMAFSNNLWTELGRILDRSRDQIIEQIDRAPALCTAPEDADLIRDSNGTIIGQINLKNE